MASRAASAAARKAAKSTDRKSSDPVQKPDDDTKPKTEPTAATEAAPVVKMVRLDAITADPKINPREKIDQDTVDEYADVYRADPMRMPPPIVVSDGQTNWLASGFHRSSAAADAGLEEIRCEVRQGTRRDAVILAQGANKTNGRRMSREDKRRAVENMLRECPDWSARMIAEYLEVSDTYVGDVKKEIFPNASKGKTVGKDGKVRSAPKKTEREPDPKSWRAVRLAMAWDVPEDLAEETMAAIVAEGITTCGELCDALLAGKTFGLTLLKVEDLKEQIEIMSADDPDPVKFDVDEEALKAEADAEDVEEDADESDEPTALFADAPSTEPPPPGLQQSLTTEPPGPVAGNWKWTEASSKVELDAEFVVTGNVITGTIGQGNVDKGPPDGNFRTGTVVGSVIDFDCTRREKGSEDYITHRYQGKLIDNDHISGTITHDVDGFAGPPTKERWDARRLMERVARDQLGRELPPMLRHVFSKDLKTGSAGRLLESARLIANGAQALKFANTDDFTGGYLKTRPHLAEEPRVLAAFIRRNLVPYCVCPICDGDGDAQQCPTCAGKGWLSRRGFDEAAEPARERARKLGLGEVGDVDASEDAAVDQGPTRFIPAGPGLDPTGHEIPPALRDLFAADWLQDEARRLERFGQILRGSVSWLSWLKPEAHETVDALIRHIRDAIPFAVCRECNGAMKGCGACKCSGYIPKYVHEDLEAQKRQHRSETRPDTKRNQKPK